MKYSERTFFLVILVLSFLLNTGMKGYELPEVIKKQLHSEREYRVKVIKNNNISDLKKLVSDPEMAKIIVVQVKPENMTDEYSAVLNKWVADEGGSLWFYDSRLAHFFGFQNSPVNPEEKLSKELAGEYGDVRRFKGKAVVASAFGKHPLLTGVTGATVFILQIGENEYSAVKSGGDVKPLLKITPSSDCAVSAIREVGKGKILFKPLLWPNQVDGGRFQVNCLEYSAGFPVPQIINSSSSVSDEMLVPGKEAEKWDKVDILFLNNSRTIPGKIRTQIFKMETPNKSVEYRISEIRMIKISPIMGKDTILTLDGRENTGVLLESMGGYEFTMPNGKVVKFRKKEIKSIIFSEDRRNVNIEVVDT